MSKKEGSFMNNQYKLRNHHTQGNENWKCSYTAIHFLGGNYDLKSRLKEKPHIAVIGHLMTNFLT